MRVQVGLEMGPQSRLSLLVGQAVRPDLLQQVAQRGDHRVLLHADDGHLAIEAQLDRLGPHLLQQHPLDLPLAILRTISNENTSDASGKDRYALSAASRRTSSSPGRAEPD